MLNVTFFGNRCPQAFVTRMHIIHPYEMFT